MAFVCTTCGNEPTPGATFCRHCGSQLNFGAAAAPGYNQGAPPPPQSPYPGQQPPVPPPGPSPSYGGGQYGSQSYPPPPPSNPSYGAGQYGSPSYPPPPQNSYNQYDPGQQWQQSGGYYPNQMNMMAMGPQVSPFANNPTVNPLKRWLAYFLDCLPMGIIGVIGVIPIVGNILGGLLGIFYMLFRDTFGASGASIGKQVVGNAIVTSSGMVPTKKDLVMRNVPLAIPYLFLMIPLVGPIVCLIVGVPVFLTEHIMALLTGLRVGDRIAGTRVVERT